MFRRITLVALATVSLSMPAAWAGPIADRLIAAGYSSIRVADKERSISLMPRPQPVDSSGMCQKTEMRFEGDAAKLEAGWTSLSYEAELNYWAVAHWGERAGRRRTPWCIDGEFAARAWQAALREPPTGVLTALQMARLVNVVDNVDEYHRRNKERRAQDRKARGVDTSEEPAASLLADVTGSDDGQTVPAFGFLLGAPLALAVCPVANADDPARVCVAPAHADRAHPSRALEFHRMDVFVPDGSPQSASVADGLVAIQFPVRQRPDFLPKRFLGVRGLVAQGRLLGVSAFVEPNIDMVGRFMELYGAPILTRTGTGSGSRLMLSFKTANGTAKLDCDGQGSQCTFAQVLTHTAPQLLQGIMLAAHRAGGDSVSVSGTEGQAQRNMREHIQQQSSEMLQRQQRMSEQARREEAEESERVRRQNDQIRRQQEMYEDIERRRRATGN